MEFWTAIAIVSRARRDALPSGFHRAYTPVIGLASNREEFIASLRTKLRSEGLRLLRVDEVQSVCSDKDLRRMSSDLQSRAASLTSNDPVDFGNLHLYKDEEDN